MGGKVFGGEVIENRGKTGVELGLSGSTKDPIVDVL